MGTYRRRNGQLILIYHQLKPKLPGQLPPSAATWSIADNAVALAAHIEVVIGRGTNTAAEKTIFVTEMMQLLRDVLGPELPDETYVVVHEIDRESYGRGGVTRAARDRENQAGVATLDRLG
jgi:phenylpyruvate tautomerase PptA (4-oxalocrotonate tautomerase family)